jgi:hypothetical protein
LTSLGLDGIRPPIGPEALMTAPFGIALIALGTTLCVAPALASIPSPGNSDIPCGVNLVGTSAGVPDPRGEFSIVVRDNANNPIPNVRIEIDFCSCRGPVKETDIRLCAVQPDGDVISVVCSAECPGGLMSADTDGTGTLTLTLVGAGNNALSFSPAAPFMCAIIYADGVNLGTVNVGAYDQNGAGGVNPADISVWLADSFDGDIEGRSDFNCSNSVNPADLSLLLGVSLGSGSAASCSSYCF